MLTNRTSGNQEIDPAAPFCPGVEVEDVAQRTLSETPTATPTNTTTEASLEGKAQTPTTSSKRTSDGSEPKANDFPRFEQPKTDVSKYNDEDMARLADISGLSCEEAAKVPEDCDDCSKYLHPQRPALSIPVFNAIRVDSDQLVTPWWELDGEDTEIIEDHLTINVFGE